MEEWKSITHNTKYEVSNQGRVRNSKSGTILKPEMNSQRYYRVSWVRDGIRTRKFIHRLVAEAFLDNSDALPNTDHIDGNTQNNSVSNLRWVSKSGNMVNMKVRKDKANTTFRNVHKCFDGWCWSIQLNGERVGSRKFSSAEDCYADFEKHYGHLKHH